MMNLPVDIWRSILLRLPAVSLLRLRAVCKGWCSIFDDPCFIKAHTNHDQLVRPTFIIRNSTGPPFAPLYYVDLEDLNFSSCGLQTIPATPLRLTLRELSREKAFPVPACNGLMLIGPVSKYRENCYLDREGTWEIMNPLTEERLRLPQPTNINDSDRIQGIGLGYDSAADDYKVLVIHGEDYDKQTHVYSLRWDSWRTTKIGSCPFGEDFRNRNGVSLSGALHWLSDDRIIVFDVGAESYRQLAFPSSFDTGKPQKESMMRLDVLSGCLFLSYNSNDRFDLWVMNDYGGKYKWTKLLELGRTFFRPITYMKNNKRPRVLLQGRYKNEFVWFDVESKTSRRIDIHGITNSTKIYSAQVCVGSLLRLHDSCGGGGRRPRRTRDAVKLTAAHAKLTFCVRDGDQKYNVSHDNCQNSDSCPNWYHSKSSSSIKVCETSTFDPAATTLISLDFWREIFLRLPAKSLIQFRAVCRDWKAVIDDPCFEKAHTNSSNTTVVMIRNKTGPPFHPLYSFDLDELDFTKELQKITANPHELTGFTKFPCFPVSECNGLMLVDDDEKFQLWNPLTNERLELPKVEELINKNPKGDAFGFGYEEATNDYKVVVIHWDVTHVYSLRRDSWKKIGRDWTCGDDWWRPKGRGIFLCGPLHWLSPGLGKSKILALDLMTESYREIQGPRLGRECNIEEGNRFLGVLDGCLIVTDWGRSKDYEEYFFDVWVMKKDYGSQFCSWFKLIASDGEDKKFCVRGVDELRPFSYVKNKTRILLQDGDKRFYLHHLESDFADKVICIHGLAEKLSSQIFSGSIFRLHDNCGVSGKRRERKRLSKKNKKRPADTELYFCVRDVVDPADYDYEYEYDYDSHDGCYTVDSNWYCSFSENED